jgi:hypothetical protein
MCKKEVGCVAQLTNEKFMLGYKLVTLKFQRSVAIPTQISIFTNNYAEIYSKAFFLFTVGQYRHTTCHSWKLYR